MTDNPDANEQLLRAIPEPDQTTIRALIANPGAEVHEVLRALADPDAVPGQLPLIPDTADLHEELARLDAEARRLRELRAEHTYRALDRIVAAAKAQTDAGAELDAAVADARAAGATWEQIGKALGMSRQSAHERWAR
jgi:hypothetical protein